MTENDSTAKRMAAPKIEGGAPRVLLVYPFSPNKNTSPPLGLAMIGAVLRGCGCEVKAVDAAACLVEDGEARIVAALDQMRPDAVGLSIIVGNALSSYDLISNHLSGRNIQIFAGGPHATVCAREALEHGVGVVVRGEGESAVADLTDWLKGKRDLSGIAGLSYIGDDGEIHDNTDRPPIENLDALPMPAHDLFDPADYFERAEDFARGGKIFSSRGCPNKCSFCANPIHGRKFRYRSSESIVAEMEMLSARYGIDRFEFIDDAFTANRKNLLALCVALQNLPNVTFSCITRLENLDRETAPALRSAGLYRAYIGVESGRPETLKRIHKNIRIENLEPVLRILRKNGVETSLFFMYGFPWESAGEMRETNRFIEKISSLATLLNEGGVVAPYPGTEIYDEYHESVGFTEWWLRNWQPPGAKPLHPSQPYYFFNYSDDQLEAIREGLDYAIEHNRSAVTADPYYFYLRGREFKNLEEQLQDRDRRLHELWDKSPRERLRRMVNRIRKKLRRA